MQDCTIVLVHGLTIVRHAEGNFVGVAAALEARGFRVRQTLVRGDGSLNELASRVWAQIDGISGPLVLLCHSMGGLEARTFLLDEAKAARLLAIVTVGTPHTGTRLATMMSPFNQAYRELTATARARWSEAHAAVEQANATRFGVKRLSVVAALRGEPGYRRLVVPHRLLSATEGPSDGLVPAAAQRWGKVAFEVDLDHLECACVHPPSRRRDECVGLWGRMAEMAVDGVVDRAGT